MNAAEKKATFALASVFAIRMLGLFMLLPVLSLYALHLTHSTPLLMGLAVGIYGLTQAIFQIPFGTLSDKFGRKKIIVLGFVIFILGSIVAAFSTSIAGLILGRALQGAGAVGSTIIALLADLTDDENRTTAMAIIGSSIGVTFAISVILGPLLKNQFGVHSIFWITAVLGVFAILVTLFLIPTPTKSEFHPDAEPTPKLFWQMLKNKQLLRLDIGILLSHALLTMTFVGLPIALKHVMDPNGHGQWLIYLPTLLLAFICMVPMIIVAEKKSKMKTMLLLAIFMIICSEFLFWVAHHSLASLIVSMFIFFTAFSFLEAALPSLISKLAPKSTKGTAMGIYSSAQFLGIFLGGYLGGFLYQHGHLNSIYSTAVLLACLWFYSAWHMSPVKKVVDDKVVE